MEGDGSYVTERENLRDTVRLFKIFSDETRLRIIDLLMDGEYCVQDICEKLDMQQSTVSHQLRLLRDENVVRRRRSGKKVIYALKDLHVKTIYQMARSHVEEC